MIRYIIISTLVHVLCVVAISLKVKQETKPQGEEATTVTLVEPKSTGNKSGAGRDVQVIEMNPAGKGTKRESEKFYWGVGIGGDYAKLETGTMVYKVNTVYGGYTADAAGILPGDLIYSVNGRGLESEDISGDGPARLMLGIIRDNQFIMITLDRTKVYY